MAGYTLDDRVYETTTTTGTGTVNLGGAQTGYQTFVAGIGSGNSCTYCISDQGGANWEVGIGTVTSGSPATLSRTTVLNSSNAGSLVNFAAGTKDVVCTRSAAQMLKPAKVILKTSGTSYTPTAGTVALLVQCIGGGGGGASAPTAASSAAAGGGGGGGSQSITFIAGPLKASYSYAIGGGGTGGASGASNPGNAGGDTTFDSPSVCTGTGSGGGAATGAGTSQLVTSGGGAGAGTQVGDIQCDVDPGGWGLRLSGTVAVAGYGGGAGFGGGRSNPKTSAGAGNNGAQYGGGGGAGLVLNGSASVAGGNGNPGAIIITEYIA